jgi:hypothetical protein
VKRTIGDVSFLRSRPRFFSVPTRDTFSPVAFRLYLRHHSHASFVNALRTLTDCVIPSHPIILFDRQEGHAAGARRRMHLSVANSAMEGIASVPS